MLRTLTALAAGVGFALVLTQYSAADPSYEDTAATLKKADDLMKSQSFIDDYKYNQQLLKDHASDVNLPQGGTGFSLPKDLPQEGLPQLLESVEKAHQQIQQSSKSEGFNGPMVFVSLSMPRETIKKLMREMNQVGGVVIFRGLKNNNFKETLLEIRGISEDSAAAIIDPTLFKRFEISQVPTFVVPIVPDDKCMDEDENCKAPENFKASGDVEFRYILEMVERTGPKSEKYVAQQLLKKLNG